MAKTIIPKGRARQAEQAPLAVFLTVRLRFGDAEDDRITMIERQKVPMVHSVFENRDRIVRQFVKLLVLGGVRSPRVVRELNPLAIRKRRRKTRGGR